MASELGRVNITYKTSILSSYTTMFHLELDIDTLKKSDLRIVIYFISKISGTEQVMRWKRGLALAFEIFPSKNAICFWKLFSTH